MAAIHVFYDPLHVIGIVQKHKSIAFGEARLVTGDDHFVDAVLGMWLDDGLELLQRGVVRHVHQVDAAVETGIVPASHAIRVSFFEIRRDLADSVVIRAIVKCRDALLGSLLVCKGNDTIAC